MCEESAAQRDIQAANSSIRALHMAKMRQDARQCLSFNIAKGLRRNIPDQRANSHSPWSCRSFETAEDRAAVLRLDADRRFSNRISRSCASARSRTSPPATAKGR